MVCAVESACGDGNRACSLYQATRAFVELVCSSIEGRIRVVGGIDEVMGQRAGHFRVWQSRRVAIKPVVVMAV
jgi:hypothetical protein